MALQVLYEADSRRTPPGAILERTFKDNPLPPEGQVLTRELVDGVHAHTKALDQKIGKYAPAYPVDQLSVIDRNILRIAMFELLMNNKTPPKVAVNEAVELAKLFGSTDIHRFINGVLGSALKDAAPDQGISPPGGNSGDGL